jgi:hypothetical protein
VRSTTGTGKRLQRVHILRSPLTEYLRFELGRGYVGNARAGEDIRIIGLASGEIRGLPDKTGIKIYVTTFDRFAAEAAYREEMRSMGGIVRNEFSP